MAYSETGLIQIGLVLAGLAGGAFSGLTALTVTTVTDLAGAAGRASVSVGSLAVLLCVIIPVLSFAVSPVEIAAGARLVSRSSALKSPARAARCHFRQGGSRGVSYIRLRLKWQLPSPYYLKKTDSFNAKGRN